MLSRWTGRYEKWIAERFSLPFGVRITDWRRLRRKSRRLQMTHMAISSLPDSCRFRELNFTFAIIALAAKLAQVDGQAGEEEFIAFCQTFPVPAGESEKIRHLFESATRDGVEPAVYARRIVALFPKEQYRSLLKDMVWRLIDIARADGEMNALERDFLIEVMEIFAIRSRALLRRLHQRNAPPVLNPYMLLKVQPDWSNRQIRHSYLRLIRDSHPDKVQAEGGSKDAVKAAGRHMALLNIAYARICRERGLKGALPLQE